MHVPGWHAATRELRDEGRIRTVGIVEEQHPDRTRLFMQWKQMDWPILVDPLGLLDVPYVPITIAIDEHGIIREILPFGVSGDLEERFVSKTYEAPGEVPPVPDGPPDLEARERAALGGASAEALRRYADALVQWGGPERLGDAIEAYEKALELEPGDGTMHFRLGVAHRMRYDGPERRAEDFQRAVDHWTAALDADPNNYIRRRRLQQYGPRLDKPYPFYNWIVEARRDIEERGETPVPLVVEPGETELAAPASSFTVRSEVPEEPDPEGRIHRDPGLIEIETAVVPPEIEPGSLARLHVVLRPSDARDAHWNNEVEDLVLWVDPPEGWRVDERRLTYPNPPVELSREARKLELEIRAPEGAPRGTVNVPAYALYYVCEGENGTCLYRRRDVPLEIRVAGK
jgi:hypothetical protein